MVGDYARIRTEEKTMTKEYIIRDEMIEQIKARVVLGAPRFNTGLEAAIEVATSLPAADVVEIPEEGRTMYEDLVKLARHCAEVDACINCPVGGCQGVTGIMNRLADAVEELSKPRWIPVTARPMDEEERKEWSEKLGYDIEYNEALIYTSQLPDDGQEVLTFSKYGGIRIDKFEDDPDCGCFFEVNGDMDGIVAWMPLPEPPKERK